MRLYSIPGDPLRDGGREDGVVEEDARRLVHESGHRLLVRRLRGVAVDARQAAGLVDEAVVLLVHPVGEVEERCVAAVEHRPQVVRAGVAVGRPVEQQEHVLSPVEVVALGALPLLVEGHRRQGDVDAELPVGRLEERCEGSLVLVLRGVRDLHVEAVDAGLGHERLGLLHVGLVLRRVLGVREDARGDRSSRLGAQTCSRHLDDVRIGRRVGQRLPHERVVEGRALRVEEAHVVEERGLAQHREVRVRLVLVEALRGQVEGEVDLAAVEGLLLVDRLWHDRHEDLLVVVNIVPASPVVGELREQDLPVGDPGLEHVGTRPGTDAGFEVGIVRGRGLEGLGAHDPGAVERRGDEVHRRRVAEMECHGQGVDRLDGLDRRPDEGGTSARLGGLHGTDDGSRRERLAILERHPVAKVERPRQAILAGLPLGGQGRRERLRRAGRVHPQQRLVHVGEIERFGRERLHRVPGRDVGGVGDLEDVRFVILSERRPGCPDERQPERDHQRQDTADASRASHPGLGDWTVHASLLALFPGETLLASRELAADHHPVQYFCSPVLMPWRHEPWRSSRMDLRHLRYFLATVDAGSITRAAQVVSVAQPSLSRQLRQLEAELGERLFDRTQGSAQLTAAGRVLLPLARDLVGRADQAQAAMRGLSDPGRLPLRLVAPETTVADVIAPFLATQPVSMPVVDVREALPAEVYAAVLSGLADVGSRSARPRASWRAGLLVHFPIWAYVRADHRWSRRSTIGVTELTREPLIVLGSEHGTRRLLDAAMADAGLSYALAAQTDVPQVAQALAASGRGVADRLGRTLATAFMVSASGPPEGRPSVSRSSPPGAPGTTARRPSRPSWTTWRPTRRSATCRLPDRLPSAGRASSWRPKPVARTRRVRTHLTRQQ